MVTTTVYTDRDCSVLESSPTDTGIKCTSMDIISDYTTLGGYYAVLGFPIPSSPISANITNVTLHIRCRTRGTLDTQTMKRITTDSWGECTSSYNSITVTDVNLATFGMPVDEAWTSINITGMYKDAVDAGMSIFGVRQTNPNTASAVFWARDNGTGYIAYITITSTAATDYYVKTAGDDTKTGESWANAWATINKAATTVADGTTVHIGHGTYNNEPTSNKIAPQNAGALGIKYKPVTADTSAEVAGTITIEKN